MPGSVCLQCRGVRGAFVDVIMPGATSKTTGATTSPRILPTGGYASDLQSGMLDKRDRLDEIARRLREGLDGQAHAR